MTFEETIAFLRVHPSSVAGVVVAPDVFERLQRYAHDPNSPPVHAGGLAIYVNRSLAPGSVVPVDVHGNPVPKGSKVPIGGS